MKPQKKYMVKCNNLTKSGFTEVGQAYTWARENVQGYFVVYLYWE